MAAGETSDRRTHVPARFWLFLAAFFAAWIVRATVLFWIDERFATEAGRLVYSNVVKLALWVAPAFAYTWAVEKKSPLSFCKIDRLPDASGWAWSVATIVVFLAAVALSLVPRGFKPTASWPAALASVAVSPVTEEIFFRGFVQSELRLAYGFVRANVLTTLFFVAIHWPFWLWKGAGREIFVTSGAVAVLALVLGALVEKTGSIWPSVLLHIGNNFVNAIAV